jgi:hypothetical protein
VIHGVARRGGQQAQIARVFGRATGAQFARARGGVEVLEFDAIGLERRGEEFDVVHGANLGRGEGTGAGMNDRGVFVSVRFERVKV